MGYGGQDEELWFNLPEKSWGVALLECTLPY